MEPEPFYKNKKVVTAIIVIVVALAGIGYYFLPNGPEPVILIRVATDPTTKKLTGAEAEAFLKTLPEEVRQALLPQKTQ